MAAKDDVGPDGFSLSTWARKGSFLFCYCFWTMVIVVEHE